MEKGILLKAAENDKYAQAMVLLRANALQLALDLTKANPEYATIQTNVTSSLIRNIRNKNHLRKPGSS